MRAGRPDPIRPLASRFVIERGRIADHHRAGRRDEADGVRFMDILCSDRRSFERKPRRCRVDDACALDRRKFRENVARREAGSPRRKSAARGAWVG